MAEDTSRMMLALMMVVGLLSVVAIVIGAIAISQKMAPVVSLNSGSGAPMQQPQLQVPPVVVSGGLSAAGGIGAEAAPYPVGAAGRIYSLTIGHDYGSHEYIDEKGYLAGFGFGLVDLVCKEALIDCRLVWDRYENCWDSEIGQHAMGGKGLMDRWYDGCVGWYTTIPRMAVFMFTQPYLKQPTTRIYVLKGKSFTPDKDTLSNKKILFLGGWASDEKCFARQTDVMLSMGNAKYVDDIAKAVEEMRTMRWDALFVTHVTAAGLVQDETLEYLDGDYACMVAGNGVMTRKDSDLPGKWNRGFNLVKANGKFRQYCEDANREHAHKGSVDCVDAF